MPLEFIRLSSPLPASASRVYEAWLDSHEHTVMTGGPATVDARIGGRCTAWDGYIEWEILDLEPARRILQSWRSSEFPPDHPASLLEVRFRDVEGGCEIMLAHSDIPEGQGEKYEKGWHEHYFIPMTKYFRGSEAPPKKEEEAVAAPVKKAAAKKTAPKKVTPKKAVAKKAAARKTVAKKAPKKKAAPKAKASAKKKVAPRKSAPKDEKKKDKKSKRSKRSKRKKGK